MSYLQPLLDSTRKRVEETKSKLPPAALEQRLASVEEARGFAGSLQREGIAVIAEIKRASPAKGPLDLDLNAAEVARAYAAGGAAALSVLTEPVSFRGSMEDLEAARGAGLPVLRKDFILDPYQLLESRAAGADAVLLIVRALGEDLASLLRQAGALGLDALVEVHDEADLERALAAGATLVGVNHRDLETFEVIPDQTAKLAALVPAAVTLVALSGVSAREEVAALDAAGADAVLVGESLVTAPDPEGKLRELLART